MLRLQPVHWILAFTKTWKRRGSQSALANSIVSHLLLWGISLCVRESAVKSNLSEVLAARFH